MTMIQERNPPHRPGLSIHLQDLWIGWGRDPSEAYAAASEKLDDYITTCEEALDMLDFEERAGLPFDPEVLLSASPLSLWVVDGGLEVQAKGTTRSGYTLGRARGSMNRATARQALQSALSLLSDVQSTCERKIES